MTSIKPDTSTMSVKDLMAELTSYDMSTESYLDKESLVEAVKKARGDGIKSEHLLDMPNMENMAEERGEPFVSPLPMLMSCGSEPSALWRQGIFTGIVGMPNGEFIKLDSPRSFQADDFTGHKMTMVEQMTEFSHYPETYVEKPGRSIKDNLVDYRGMEGVDAGEIVHKQCVEEIYSFVNSLAPHCVAMSREKYLGAIASLKAIIKQCCVAGEVTLDNEAKALIALLVTGGRESQSLPAEAAQGMCSAMHAVELDDMDEKYHVEGTYVEPKADGTEDAEEQTEEKKVEYDAFGSPKQAEDAALELITRLSNQWKAAEEHAENEEDDGMYPFHVFEVGEKYSDVPAPKVRSGDVIEVTVAKDLTLNPGFVIKAGAAVRVYVISVAPFGIVTGIVQSNKKKYWAYFPIHCAKQRVLRGVNW